MAHKAFGPLDLPPVESEIVDAVFQSEKSIRREPVESCKLRYFNWFEFFDHTGRELDDLEGYMTKGCETVNDNKQPMLPVCPTCGRRNFPHWTAARKHLKHCAFAKRPRWVRIAERNQKLPGLLCCFCGQVFLTGRRWWSTNASAKNRHSANTSLKCCARKTGPVPAAAVGTFSVDAAGNISGEEARSVGGGFAKETITGSWTVNSDCTATLTANIYESGALVRTSVLALVFVDNSSRLRGVQESLTQPDGTTIPVVITAEGNKLFHD